jgi:hypothetical protein
VPHLLRTDAPARPPRGRRPLQNVRLRLTHQPEGSNL